MERFKYQHILTAIMKRKVSKIGPATLMVSLPSKWAKQFNIKKGEEIDLEQDSNKLVITAGKSIQSKKIEIDLSKASSLTRRYLMEAYRSGFDEIKVSFPNSKDLKLIQDTTSDILLGFEIVEQGKNNCILRNVTRESDEEFENVLRRIFQVTSVMIKNGLDAIKKNDFELLKEAYVLEITNNRFALYCERMLNKIGRGSYTKTNFTFAIVYQLEKIADELKYIFDYISGNRIKSNDGTIKLYEKISIMFDLCQKLYYDFNEKDAETLLMQRKEIISASEKLFRTANKNEARIVGNLVNMAQFIYNVLGCSISLTFQKD